MCRNKRPGRSIFRSNNKNIQKPIKSHRFCVIPPPFEESPIKAHWFCVLPPLNKSPIKGHRFCVLPPLKNHCFWWALISGWAFISVNTIMKRKKWKFEAYGTAGVWHSWSHGGANQPSHLPPARLRHKFRKRCPTRKMFEWMDKQVEDETREYSPRYLP